MTSDEKYHKQRVEAPQMMDRVVDVLRGDVAAGMTKSSVKRAFEVCRADPRPGEHWDNSLTSLYAREIKDVEPEIGEILEIRTRWLE